MSEYLGKSFDRDLRNVCFLFVVVGCLLFAASFGMGRCSARHDIKIEATPKATDTP